MIGIDTNILLRYILKDDPVQTRKAEKWIEACRQRDEIIFIHPIVLCETIWVLSHSYDVPESELLDVIELLLDMQGIHMGEEEAVSEALDEYRRKNIGFSDLLIASSNRHAGVAHTATFDKKAAVLPEFRLIKSRV